MRTWHMSGAGNDFIVVDARNRSVNMEALAKDLCAKYGADGFMALDTSCVADIKLHFYNSDGSRAEMCGNGARCICRYAFDNGIVGEEMRVETDAGVVFGKRITETVYQVKLNTPKCIELDKKRGVDYAVVGVPHACVKLSNVDWNNTDDIALKARELRYDPIFENGANVNFYSKIDENVVKILTYERGVEDFTLACGTGSGAVATILWQRGELSNGAVTLKNKGGELKVFVNEKNGEIDSVFLEGNAEILEKMD